MATAFPDVVHDMAEHIDWTQAMGDAMLAQSDDVLNAVQVMRDQAVTTGALVSNDQQTVTEDPATESVIIQPADPEVVYVPQYDAQAVYDPGFSTGDAITAGLITWGTFTVLDAIFDDDDDWDDYWGCRNCAGWGGGPIIRDPDIDIDIDGNVNIGNEIDFDGNQIRDRIEAGDIRIDNDELRNRFETGDIDRDELRNRIDAGDIQIEDGDFRARLEDREGGWVPDDARRDEARQKLAGARGDGGATTLPIERPASGSTDALRAKLTEQTGVADIASPEGRLSFGEGLGAAAAGGAAGALAGGAANRPQGGRPQGSLPQIGDGSHGDGAAAANLKAKAPAAKPVAKPAAKAKPVSKPQVNRPAAQANRPAQKVKRPTPKATKSVSKIAKKSSGGRAKAASARGFKGGGKKFGR